MGMRSGQRMEHDMSRMKRDNGRQGPVDNAFVGGKFTAFHDILSREIDALMMRSTDI